MSTSEALRQGVDDALTELESVYRSEPFVALLDELWRVQPGQSRYEWVQENVIDPASLEARGIHLPTNIRLERTYFDDDRPTLFALVKHLPPGLPFTKVTITVDDVDSTAPSN